MSALGYKLDPATHDLVLAAGSLARLDTELPEEWVAQSIKTRLLFFRGEYFLDVRLGVPYYQVLLRKGVDIGQVKGVIAQVINSVPGVAEVDDVTVTIDPATRNAAIGWAVKINSGLVVTSEDFTPLLVEL